MKGFVFLTTAILLGGTAALLAQTKPAGPEYFFDDTSQRFLIINPQGFNKVQVVVRHPGGGRWVGDGEKQEKQMVFAQTAGEGQERGTFFLAKGGESKWEIGFKPDQRQPQDAGINGLYRRVSEEKRLQLARKECQAAETTLDQSLKTAAKAASGLDKSLLAQWKDRWPSLRDRWVSLVFTMPSAPKPEGQKQTPFGGKSEPPGQERQADYWFAMAETASRAMAFVTAPLDKSAALDWNGVYDDGFGGQINIRSDLSGKLRITVNFSRGNDQFTGGMAGQIESSKIVADKGGSKTAEVSAKDVAMAEETTPAVAKVRLRRAGRFMVVETENAQKIAGRGWFDGIYRWAPLPKE